MDRPFATTCSLGKGMTACFKRSGYFETKPERRADVSSANGDVKLHDSPVCPEGAANYCRVEAERDAVVEELKEYPALARLDVCTWHFAPLVVRPLSARCDGGTESAAAQPARPNVTTLPVALRPSAAAIT